MMSAESRGANWAGEARQSNSYLTASTHAHVVSPRTASSRTLASHHLQVSTAQSDGVSQVEWRKGNGANPPALSDSWPSCEHLGGAGHSTGRAVPQDAPQCC
eukprot:CAMPEP_0185189602 /NCGR_PEP_ID=MMETSP1140-20130426/6141_1 /TAXON_ID=298111 /ORGANISM="Pavlova sp., Strain CCMP459" /LENGTH=101 /DNA_ID=CAMNT_0027756179 /DNA_START=56 /DNA_END=362 /DNA_ORIENTATION=-